MAISNTQADRLGERLRVARSSGAVSPDDTDRYGTFRESFEKSLAEVRDLVRARVGASSTGRLKTLGSTIAKLVRQPTARLSQIQDIAGIRMVVPELGDQETLFGALLATLEDPTIDDRRVEPMHGYRAVHVIVRAPESRRVVEIQVRTELQDLWAQVSEKLADELGLDVKYGGGPPEIRDLLDRLSHLARGLDEERDAIRQRRDRVLVLQDAVDAVGAAGGGGALAEARADIVEAARAVEDLRQVAERHLVDFREIVRDLLAY